MQIPWDSLGYLQSFFQLNFLFSGVEVSSGTIFLARAVTFIIFGVGLVYMAFRVLIKILDCLQAFLAGLGQLPWTFFLAALLLLPVSPDSLGAQWIGYILLVLSLLGVAVCGVLGLIGWKYGVDQALRLIGAFRTGKDRAKAQETDYSLPIPAVLRPPDSHSGSSMRDAAEQDAR